MEDSDPILVGAHTNTHTNPLLRQLPHTRATSRTTHAPLTAGGRLTGARALAPPGRAHGGQEGAA